MSRSLSNRFTMRRFQQFVLVLPLFLLHACAVAPPESGLGEAVPWDQLSGWRADHQAQAWPALRRSCSRLADQLRWRKICRQVDSMPEPSDREARVFFETHFRAFPVYGDDGRRSGLITGYYEPSLNGSFRNEGRYQYPLYGPSADLLRLDLGDAYPKLKGERLRGRLDGRTVKPYPDRARLDSMPNGLDEAPLLWVDDPIDAFFLHVQGSGRVRLPNGETVGVGFADHNGRPYRSIGRKLIDMGELSREDVNLFTIRRWLRAHPEKGRSLMHHNPRYVFFRLRDEVSADPNGALNVPLTAGRSLAVDADKVPLGVPVWLETSMPGQPGEPLERLMLAQDTGAAVQGPNRGDVFWGGGEEAERLAGLMKQNGRMFVILPREE